MAAHSYMVVAPHAVDECLASLDHIASNGDGALSKWRWGCASGLHIGYGLIDAENDEEARSVLPEPIRHKALVVKVTLFTMEHLRTIHEAY